MKPFLEFEGKNVEKAVEKACAELQSSKSALKYDIISNGSSGIFGLVGVKKAKIRVLNEEQPGKTSDDYEGINNKSVDGKEDEVNSLVDEAFNEKEKEPIIKGNIDNREKRYQEKKRRGSYEVSEEIIAVGREALERITGLISNDAEITVDKLSDKIVYRVASPDSSVLIGKRGQSLEAIQYIVDKVVNKKSERRIRLQVDVGGYLEKRKSNLKNLAAKLAEKTKRTRKPSTIGEMNAHDRRIVHIALRGDRKVRTQSIGEGYYRKLIIFPNKNNRDKRNKQQNGLKQNMEKQ